MQVFSGLSTPQCRSAIDHRAAATLSSHLCSPFWDKRVNRLDCACCLSIIVHSIAALYFNSPTFNDSGEPAQVHGWGRSVPTGADVRG